MVATKGARRGCLLVGVWLLAVTTPGWAQDIGYTIGTSLVRGTDAAVPMDSAYVFNGVDLSIGPVRVSASVPFIRQRAVAVEPPIVQPVATGDATGEPVSGFGDPLIRMDVRVFDAHDHQLQVSAAGSVKPPIVNPADGLGTGVADYAVGGAVLGFTQGTSVMIDVLYWKYGDPVGVDFTDSFSYGLGIGRVIGHSGWSALVSLSGFSSGAAGAPPPLQLSIGALTLTGRGQSLAITAGIGLNSGSGDFSVGASWRIQG